MSDKKILLIIYKFPPMGGVGARRWAKFSKYFARNDTHVHVVTLDYPFHDIVTWERDIDHPNITVHRLKPNHPLILLRDEVVSFPKRVISFFYKRFINNNAIDRAEGWEKTFLPYATRLIQREKIKNVIISAPPSSLHYYGSLLKKENPAIHLIQDYRDPWNTDRDYDFGSSLKGTLLKKRSQEMENHALEVSDKIVLVTKDMESNLGKLYPTYKNKMTTIYNGFDPDDKIKEETPPKKEFRFIYAGALGSNPKFRPKAIELFAEAISTCGDNFIKDNIHLDVYSDLQLEFFSYSNYYAAIQQYVTFHSFIPPKKIAQEIQRHPYCLMINADVDAHAIGSKVFEYMVQQRKILLIASPGELSRILKDKKQFVSGYNVEEIKYQLGRLKDDFQSNASHAVDYSEFSIPHLMESYEKILKF